MPTRHACVFPTLNNLACVYRLLSELYNRFTDMSAAHLPSVAASQSGAVESLEAWNARISGARRTKSVKQKWQELLLSVNGEPAR